MARVLINWRFAGAICALFVLGVTVSLLPANTSQHGPVFPPNPWDGLAHGPVFPPNPWDGLAHGPVFPPNPWDGKA